MTGCSLESELAPLSSRVGRLWAGERDEQQLKRNDIKGNGREVDCDGSLYGHLLCIYEGSVVEDLEAVTPAHINEAESCYFQDMEMESDTGTLILRFGKFISITYMFVSQ